MNRMMTPEHEAKVRAHQAAHPFDPVGPVLSELDWLRAENAVLQVNLKGWHDACNALVDEKARIAKERDAAVAANRAEFDGHKLTIRDHAAVFAECRRWVRYIWQQGFRIEIDALEHDGLHDLMRKLDDLAARHSGEPQLAKHSNVGQDGRAVVWFLVFLSCLGVAAALGYAAGQGI